MLLQTNKKVCQVELFGKTVLISERTALAVNTLSEYSAKNSNGYADLVLQNVVIVCDALKINSELLKWWQIIKKFRYKKLFSEKNIHSKLSVNTLINLAHKVLELEGVDLKKKIISDPGE